MSDELELLDQLLGGPMPYQTMERHVFAGDRHRFLNSLRLMLIDSEIAVTMGGAPVEAWRIESWLRCPHDPKIESDLHRVTLRITEIGLRKFT